MTFHDLSAGKFKLRAVQKHPKPEAATATLSLLGVFQINFDYNRHQMQLYKPIYLVCLVLIVVMRGTRSNNCGCSIGGGIADCMNADTTCTVLYVMPMQS